MRSSWLYFATRSVRDALPVLICPTPVATARSAMKVSSVSPERCEITAPYPLERACAMHCSVSVSDPIWFSLIRIAFATLSSIPRSKRSIFSAPTSSVWIALFDPAIQTLDVGAEKIVAHELDAGGQRRGKLRPSRPVVLGEPVLDRDDGVAVDPALVQRDHLVG